MTLHQARHEPTKYNYREMTENGQGDPRWQEVIEGYRMMRQVEAEQQNDKAVLGQWNDAVNTLHSTVTGVVVQLMRRQGALVDKHVIGRIKHRIAAQKMRLLGEFNKSNRHIDTAKAHYQWLCKLDASLRETGIPEWLR